ncbi:ketopantoate hydroxymethyltransferase-domain-containing protein [Melampsora americana]|nr:ketopantoate hydroxymethyltransferase-domain-containing protein [Melampsora americana]
MISTFYPCRYPRVSSKHHYSLLPKFKLQSRYSSQAFNSRSDLQESNQKQRISHTNSNRSTTLTKSTNVTFETISNLYKSKIPITMLTAHDFQSARLLAMSSYTQSQKSKPDQTSDQQSLPNGVDFCLCGDSLAMVSLGYTSTNELSLEEFTYHLKAVRRGLDSVLQPPPNQSDENPYHYRMPLLVADLPFGTFEGQNPDRGLRTALKLISEARIDAVKIEGGTEQIPLIKILKQYGVPVIGHLGLQPQRIAGQGGMKVQGSKEIESARDIIKTAIELQSSGVVGIVLEAIPEKLSIEIQKRLSIFTIGIGAGQSVDGQVLVTSDLLGSLDSVKPRFIMDHPSNGYQVSKSNPRWDLELQITHEYISQTRSKQFPNPDGQHSYKMNSSVFNQLQSEGWT